MYMNEINGSNFSVGYVQYRKMNKNAQEKAMEIQSEENPQLTDFSDLKAEVLGRSMMLRFKSVDNVNTDLKELIENPQIADNSENLFNATYKIIQDNNIENPYEEAASLSTATV